MANSWLRLWHDMPNDPKWRTISRASKQSISSVIAVYIHILVIASNASERGRTQNICNEDIASALDLDCEQVDAIIEAMQGRVLDGDVVSGWKKRQIEREDGGAERAKAWRENKKRTQANASERKRTPDTDTDTDTDNNKLLCKDKKLIIPDWIDKSMWDMWLKSRKKMTIEQQKAQINKLSKWRDLGFDYAGALENSAVNGYTGLFLPSSVSNKPNYHDRIADTMSQIFSDRGENGFRNKIIDITNQQASGSGSEDIPKLSNGLWEKAG